jgi:hypothetical protein
MVVAEINNLVIYKGTDFEATFNLFESDNSAVNLNNLGTSYASVRKFPTSIAYEDFGITITALTGTIKLTLTAEKTSRLTVGRNYFDVILTISSKKIPTIRGTIIVEESNSL